MIFYCYNNYFTYGAKEPTLFYLHFEFSMGSTFAKDIFLAQELF
jgi:hypothetical protein